MIKVEKKYSNLPPNPDNVPASLIDQKAKATLKTILNNKSPEGISDKHYGQADVKKKLYELYHSKCGYCEIKEHNDVLQIDHYRPKNRKSNRKDYNEFKGYYWLALEWSNLVLVCGYCNRYKSEQFDISGTVRAKVENFLTNNEIDISKCIISNLELKQENPLIVNPEVDNPDNSLYFKNDGTIHAKDNKGIYTIKVFHLYDDRLVKKRKEIIDHYIEDFLNKYKAFKEIFGVPDFSSSEFKNFLMIQVKATINDIEKRQKPEYEFSRFRKYLADQFIDYVIPYFETPLQDVIKNVYNQLKS
ncbi:MAG: hypothetical protein IPO06_00120 [Leptospiraceae bacterium]|nr:hypothetical protein [Leptospiraceae bacterium]